MFIKPRLNHNARFVNARNLFFRCKSMPRLYLNQVGKEYYNFLFIKRDDFINKRSCRFVRKATDGFSFINPGNQSSPVVFYQSFFTIINFNFLPRNAVLSFMCSSSFFPPLVVKAAIWPKEWSLQLFALIDFTGYV